MISGPRHPPGPLGHTGKEREGGTGGVGPRVLAAVPELFSCHTWTSSTGTPMCPKTPSEVTQDLVHSEPSL